MLFRNFSLLHIDKHLSITSIHVYSFNNINIKIFNIFFYNINQVVLQNNSLYLNLITLPLSVIFNQKEVIIMRYLVGFVFLLVSIWQLVITWRTFASIKSEGDKNTSPFIMLGLWNSLIFAVIFFAVALWCFLVKF